MYGSSCFRSSITFARVEVFGVIFLYCVDAQGVLSEKNQAALDMAAQLVEHLKACSSGDQIVPAIISAVHEVGSCGGRVGIRTVIFSVL